MIFVNFGVISGPVYVGFSGPECVFFFCWGGRCFYVILLAISCSICRRLGFQNRGFRMEGNAKIDFS